jgi:hypothetical protein
VWRVWEVAQPASQPAAFGLSANCLYNTLSWQRTFAQSEEATLNKTWLIFAVAGMTVMACSTSDLLPATPTLFVPASLPTETVAATLAVATETASFTPTPTVLSATDTPVVAAETSTPAVTDTPAMPSASATLTGTVQVTGTAVPQPTPQGNVFQMVTISSNQMVWGTSCTTTPVTFLVQIANGLQVTQVLLFTRLQSPNGEVSTAWNSALDMHDDGLGTFSYELSLKTIKYYQQFNQAFIEYQLVASNNQQQEVGRTQVYAHTLTLMRCP